MFFFAKMVFYICFRGSSKLAYLPNVYAEQEVIQFLQEKYPHFELKRNKEIEYIIVPEHDVQVSSRVRNLNPSATVITLAELIGQEHKAEEAKTTKRIVQVELSVLSRKDEKKYPYIDTRTHQMYFLEPVNGELYIVWREQLRPEVGYSEEILRYLFKECKGHESYILSLDEDKLDLVEENLVLESELPKGVCNKLPDLYCIFSYRLK